MLVVESRLLKHQVPIVKRLWLSVVLEPRITLLKTEFGTPHLELGLGVGLAFESCRLVTELASSEVPC